MEHVEVSESENPTFDEQFSHKKELESPAGKMSYVEIESSFPSPTDSTPLVVFPGWSITLNTEKPLLKCLADGREEKKDNQGNVVSPAFFGRNLIAAEFPRQGGEVIGEYDIPEEVVRQAELMSGLLLQQKDRVDVSVDSMAAMSMISAIKLNPQILDKIRNIMVVSPAGFSGEDNILKLIGRSLAHFGQDTVTLLKSPIERRNILKMALEMGLYVGKNPARTIKEVAAIAGSEEYGELKKLKSQLDEKGINLGFMQAESDKLTPASKLWEKIGEDTQKVWKKLSQTDYDEEPEYENRGIKVGDDVWNRDAQNEKPPFDFITMVGGGHDNRLYAQSDFGIKILRGFEQLKDLRIPLEAR